MEPTNFIYTRTHIPHPVSEWVVKVHQTVLKKIGCGVWGGVVRFISVETWWHAIEKQQPIEAN